VERGELPQWIAERLKRSGQRASADTLRFLADTTEGNLLAAQQEIDKLALLLPEGELDPEAVEGSVADVARFDVFQLSEAWLAGDAARALRILSVLESVGEAVPLILWQLGEDLHALAAVLEATSGGTPLAAALRSVRIWGKRLAALDALAKGIGRGNVWDELGSLTLALCKEPVSA
jgi:DNA polymerase-3 subunit delta